jgi:simple sugar transport system permease protein
MRGAPRWWKAFGLLVVFAGLLAGMAINAANRVAILVLGTKNIRSHPIVHVHIWELCTVCAVLAAAGAAAVAWSGGRRWVVRAAIAVGLPALLLGYLSWAPNGSRVSLSNILVATVSGSIPLLLGSTAGVLSERSGIINIAIEAEFLAGACLGAIVGSISHSTVVGLLAGIGGGMLIGAALSVLAIRYGVDQIVAGLILITLVTGITSYVTEQTLNPNQATLNSPPTFGALRIPGLVDIPVIGRALFGQSALLYLAVAAIIGSEWMFARTALGLRIRAAGENPAAALGSGVNVRRLRYGVGLVAGGIAGIGGSYFTLGSSGAFLAQMTAGLGYVALAAVIFGGWRAGRAALAALLFGFATSMATSLGLLNVNVNPSLLVMLPYLVTIVVVAGAVGQAKAPAADGVPLAET